MRTEEWSTAGKRSSSLLPSRPPPGGVGAAPSASACWAQGPIKDVQVSSLRLPGWAPSRAGGACRQL